MSQPLTDRSPQLTAILLSAVGVQRAVRLLIDTGAEVSMITQTILEELRSVPRGRRHIIEISANGAEHDEHALHINLLLTDGHAIDFRDFLVVSMADQPDGIDGLIGQDLLQDLVFVYDGPRGAFRLERG